MDVVEEGPNENHSNYTDRSIQNHVRKVEHISDFLTETINNALNQGKDQPSDQGKI